MKPTLSDLINIGLEEVESESTALRNKLTKYILSLKDCTDQEKDIVIDVVMRRVNTNITYHAMMDKFFLEEDE